MWELATGDKPYRGLNMARLVHRVLVSGGRPALPLWLPPAYTRLVTSCWAPVRSVSAETGKVYWELGQRKRAVFLR